MPLLGDDDVPTRVEVDRAVRPGEPHLPDEHLQGRLTGVLVVRQRGPGEQGDGGLPQGVAAPPVQRARGAARRVRSGLVEQGGADLGECGRVHPPILLPHDRLWTTEAAVSAARHTVG